jgi:prepilin-type processing-associated H-X9-DG protein
VRTTGDNVYVDVPASFHNFACGFAFADGHSEIHKWLGQTIRQPVKFQGGLNRLKVDGSDPNDIKDIQWLQARTSMPNK